MNCYQGRYPCAQGEYKEAFVLDGQKLLSFRAVKKKTKNKQTSINLEEK